MGCAQTKRVTSERREACGRLVAFCLTLLEGSKFFLIIGKLKRRGPITIKSDCCWLVQSVCAYSYNSILSNLASILFCFEARRDEAIGGCDGYFDKEGK